MITQTQYNDFRDLVLHNQPLRKTCRLSDLEWISLDVVAFNGIRLGCTRQALKDLIRIIGMSYEGMVSLEGSLGEEMAQRFINTLKNAIGSSKGLEVTLFVTPDRLISRIQKPKDVTLFSADTFFSTVERLVDGKGLQIMSTDFDPKTGNAFVSTTAPKSGQLQIAGLSDEVFTTGLHISRTAEGLGVDPFFHRLICTNGMVTRAFEESFRLRGLQPKQWQEFYEHLDRIEKSGFVPSSFQKKVEEARLTPASLKELETGITLLKQASSIEEGEMEMFFKGLRHTYSRMHDMGIDTTKLSSAQKASLRTPLSVWDVINGITDFASHNYGFEKKPGQDRWLQLRAGDLLTKDFDTQNIIVEQPF